MPPFQTVDRLLAKIRRQRELRTGVQEPADRSDVLTRLSLGGVGPQGERPNQFLDPTGAGGGGGGPRPLTFAQSEEGQRLAARLALETEGIKGEEQLLLEGTRGRLAGALARETDIVRGREQGFLEDTLHTLAVKLLPPEDVETAMRQVRSKKVVNSKMAFQAVLQHLTEARAVEERLEDIKISEKIEKDTLREARARITIDM